jgi:hypothetical protein
MNYVKAYKKIKIFGGGLNSKKHIQIFKCVKKTLFNKCKGTFPI